MINRKDEKGFAFILSLFLLTFLSIGFIAMFGVLTTDLKITKNLEGETRAIYIAEAGIADAILALQQNNGWTSGSAVAAGPPIIFPQGSADHYTIRYPTVVGGDIIEAVSVVFPGPYSKTIRAKVTVEGIAAPYIVSVLEWLQE